MKKTNQKQNVRFKLMIRSIALKGAVQDFFFTISSLRRKLSTTCTLMWLGRNLHASHVQHVRGSSCAVCCVPCGMKGELRC